MGVSLIFTAGRGPNIFLFIVNMNAPTETGRRATTQRIVDIVRNRTLK